MSQSVTPISPSKLLTYMSIREEWRKLVASGFLSKLDPFPGDPHARTVLMTREIQELTEGPWEGEQGKRCARLLATLQNIVAGRKLVVNLDPYSAREANMGRLDPVTDGIWDIRCRDKPGLRVFCAFLEKDVLAVFICSPRSAEVPWLHRVPLGIGESVAWEHAIKETKREWAKLLPAEVPVTGDDLNEYLTNAVHE
jgi:putative component of toxin-antitoxin plasmid stabilization module